MFIKNILLYIATNFMNKNEVLKLKNEYYTSYYCKNDICVKISFNYDIVIKCQIKKRINNNFMFKLFLAFSYYFYNNLFYTKTTNKLIIINNK